MTETERPTWAEARAEHKARQREAIAVAALEVLAGQGAGGLTMAAVAEAAGVSRPTLYRYFSDVDSILVSLGDSLGEADAAITADVLGQPGPTAQLDRLVELVVAARAHSPLTAAQLEAALPPAGRDLLHKHEQAIVTLAADVLRVGVRNGEFDGDVDPETDARLLLALAGRADAEQLPRVRTWVQRSLLRKDQP